MTLTDRQLNSLKRKSKSYKKSDARGLFVEVPSTGSLRWRFKYRIQGKEKLISFGTYPDVTLRRAREKCDEARRLLEDGLDPSAVRKKQQVLNGNTFRDVASDWLKVKTPSWTIKHTATVEARLSKHVYPFLGDTPITSVLASEILPVVRRVDQRGTIETAHRVLGIVRDVFKHALALGLVQSNPAIDLSGVLRTVPKKHFAAVIDPKDVGNLLRLIDGYRGRNLIVESALRLAPLTFVRPGELRSAEWSKIDFERQEWRYLVSKTKTPHIVPLSSQAVAVLKELFPFTGRGKYVFPSARSSERPMSDNAILNALKAIGLSSEVMTGHGFRAMARTLLDEELKFRPEIIEMQLAHSVRDPLGRAYNRTQHLEERKRMMQAWADYLDLLKERAE